MSISRVDMQIIIPKAPEVQKQIQMERTVSANNELINMNKDNREKTERINQVNSKERPEEISIKEEQEREKKRQDQKKGREKKHSQSLEDQKKEASLRAEKLKKKDDKNSNKIDIRV